MRKILSTLLNSNWSIQEEAAMSYLPMLESFITGDYNALKDLKSMETNSLISASNIPDGISMNDKVVGILPIKGVITRNDFCGEMGTETMDSVLRNMIADESINAIILDINTPGGETSFLENFGNTIANSPKPIVAYYSGLCCSAGYWLASNTQSIFASAKSDTVGSIGTMIQLAKRSENYKPEMVIVSIKATKSTEKNKAYEQAQAGNYDLIRTEILDPINEMFHDTVKAGRPGINESVLTGKTYYSAQAQELGLIDGIKSFEEVVLYAVELTNNTNDMRLPKFLSINKNQQMKKLEKASAVLGREVLEGETLTAEETQLVMNALENPVAQEENTPPAVTGEDITAIVNAAITPLTEKMNTLNGRLEKVEGSAGASASIATPAAPQASKTDVPEWENPNNPVNKALDAELAARGL